MIWIAGLLYVGMSAVSCGDTAPAGEVSLVDSLNLAAYQFRYKNLDSSCHAAGRAYQAARLYRSGRAAACNNLGFCAFMRMDFEKAEEWHRQVYGLTKNELELLVADVGLMKIYQRTALNKEFYDYRNSALRRMKRIAEDRELFVDRYERMRLNYACSEFYIVSAVYYYYLQQRPEALECIAAVIRNEKLLADTNQLLYYHYIKGAASLLDTDSLERRKLHDFDELYTTWRMASRRGYPYFEGNGVQGLANLMAAPEDYAFFQERRKHVLQQFGLPVDTLLPLRLGQLALQKFRSYNDLYQIAGAYVSIGKYLNAHGRYAEALDTLTLALECVNDHHRRFYHCEDSLDWLQTYGHRSTFSVEEAWMKQKLKTVPEWISRIREQLSVTYAGLELKEYSDYNRNVYLDILDETRQDKELESRYQALEHEAAQLNMLLVAVLVGLAGILLFFWGFNRRAKVRSRIHLHRLQQVLEVCQQITASIPSDVQTEDEIASAILSSVTPQLEELFGMKGIGIRNRQLSFPRRPGKEMCAIANVINPYIRWALENGMTSISLGDECRRLEEQRYIHELHIASNKRQNVVKKACLSIVNGIHPFIDRIVNEVHKLERNGFMDNEVVKQEKFRYIDELVTTIVEYNDILALWIKMKQGSLSLNIETFNLNELFDLLRKGGRAFEMKRQTLLVEPVDLCVKADKALTLFMINTLAENARKYTPRGGTVKVYAQSGPDYVEVSVEDNGVGLSESDVACIVGEKVYDSNKIGLDTASDREELRRNKGGGFGLINCKGIIDKYRKTDSLFHVCLFSVESKVGQGSRFYFRLPLGVRKTVMLLAVLFFGVWTVRAGVQTSPAVSDARDAYEVLLDSAFTYANEAYYCNIDGEYEWALQYIDSAMMCLNAHYQRYSVRPSAFMTLKGQGSPAELAWWDEPFDSDFHIILDIRNEAAVAFLALKQWEAYSYNNAAYTALYKLLGEDRSLEDYCRQLERSTNNKVVSIWMLVLLGLILLLGYYILYVRKRLLNRWNLEQVLEINRQVSAASRVTAADAAGSLLPAGEASLDAIPRRIVDAAFDTINELLPIDRLGIAVYNEGTSRLELVLKPDFADETAAAPPAEWLQQCLEKRACLSHGSWLAFPLVVEVGGGCRSVGVLCLELRDAAGQPGGRLLLELVARYVAIVLYNSVIKLSTQYRDIEEAQDEARRASWEGSLLHVQNMVLDNCLSTIKHETVYYPNRIRQLMSQLCAGRLAADEERETVKAVGELIEYYKGVFTILSRCASRQLEEVTFRRTSMPVAVCFEAASKYFRKHIRGFSSPPSLVVAGVDELRDLYVSADRNLLCFLLENLVDEALSCPEPGELRLHAQADGDFVRFLFTDTRRSKTQDELNQLFYPSLARMAGDGHGRLRGTEYLVCKQIIRDHDEFAGRRGCRINAEMAPGGGFTVYFTLPLVRVYTNDYQENKLYGN